ncbi:MAG: 4Fe-4S binding protein [Chloroflexota bacterium]
MIKLFGKRYRLFRPRSIWLRKVVQWGFFALIALISINHTLVESGRGIVLLSSASLHAVCPFGGVVSLYQFAAVGTFVQKIHSSSFALMAIGFVLAVLFGPVFCGWVCPLGTIQEWVSGFGRKYFKKRFNRFVPPRLDQALRYLRYGMLAWVLYMTAVTGKLIFQEYDPYFALFNFWSSEVSLIGLGVLAATLGLSFFVERPWCKYACPYGAVLGLSNLFRVFAIRRNAATCKADGACSILCPMNIAVDTKTVVRDHQCISCLECTSEAVCPVARTVEFTTPGAMPKPVIIPLEGVK